MDNIFDTKQYKTSRNAYTVQCMFEYFISILASDAFLAKLLKYIGLSDALTGILSSLISFTFLFQLFSIPLAGKLRNVKKPIIILDTLSQLFFAAMYSVPFLPVSVSVKAAAVTVLILLAYFTLYLNTSICYKWGNSFVSPDKRGSFSATKEMISLIAGIVFTLLVSSVIDRYENKGELPKAFIFTFAVMIIVCICNFTSLMNIKEKPLAESGVTQSIKEVSKRTLGNRNFRNVIILTSITEFARYMTIGFMGTYKTVDLGYSVGKIQFFNIFSSLGRFAVSKPLGKYSDKKTFADGYFLGNIMTLSAFIIGMFISPKTRILILPFTVLYQMSFAGTNQNTFNMAYSFVDEEYILSAMAVCSSIRGICGFLSSFIASALLTYIQDSGNTFFGISVHAQQVLCLLSAMLTVISLVFNKKIVAKQTENKK